MTRTQITTFLYALVCAIAALGAETGTLPVPESWKHYIAAAAVVAVWLKSHWNLFVNPDGTPASKPYEKSAISGTKPT